MKEALVRLCEIKIEGFKNTHYGLVQMPSVLVGSFFSHKPDILGIYGQNGSGKTAIIEAMNFIQRLLMGRPLPKDTVHFISKKLNRCTITATFAICFQVKQTKAEYSIELRRINDEEFEITRESLSSAMWNSTKFERKKKLISFESFEKNVQFTPGFRYNDLVSNRDENKTNFGVAKKLAQMNRLSFIFNDEAREIFLSAPEDVTADYAYIIRTLFQYASVKLFVISNEHSGGISLNLILPFAFRLDMGETIAKGDLPVRLDKPSIISQEHFDMVEQIISEMSIVLGTLIPGLSIGIYDHGEQLLENGNIGRKIELISKRGDVNIPLKYESEGIIKIISILNVLMCVFNDPSTCLIIDELDASIYEYLLGELLLVFEKGAKGQMIFTSHNLRALEMLNKSSILFSTTNPKNRYMRLQYVKRNNNLRDLYLRSITLGGQQEEVYAATDTVEIGRAFRRAGRAVLDGNEN